MQARVPDRTKHTSVRLGCDGRLDTSPASTLGHFGWRALAGPPSAEPKCHQERRGSQGVENGGCLSPPPPPPHHFHRLLRTPTQKGFLPPHPRAFVVVQAMPLSHYFCFLTLSLFSTRLASRLTTSSGKVTPRGSLCTHPRPYNMSKTSAKNVEIDKIRWKQARADSPRGWRPYPSREPSCSWSIGLPREQGSSGLGY
jgi:hypothetical protein